MIYPKALADQLKKHAGKKYQPSNGTEGEIFMNHWCENCAKDKCMSEGKPYEECEPHEVCPIIAASAAYKVDDPRYPKEWIYGGDGQPICTAFVEYGQEAPLPRCQKTMDMFEEVRA